MKRLLWPAFLSTLAFAAAIWAAAILVVAPPEVPTLFPDGALLYLQAKDLRGLLKDWDTSEEKRVWLKGDDYQAFSRSRLFERLSQAQTEFSAAASIPTDNSLLASVAGMQSALALYDIGNLEFVYVTRMDQAQIETTPLWQVRDKFEQRTEGGAHFFVHSDTQSNRTAAFAARDGWLILGTRADLIAGVLDRLQGAKAHGLTDEGWYADPVKQAASPADDLRMVLNLEKIVPSPYFRSYWIQRNISEMKQYRSALCDLHRTSRSYREDRLLLRRPGQPARASGDVQPLLALAPDDAVFASAQATTDTDAILAEMRENLLELRPVRAQAMWSAPSATQVDNVGSSSMLEERIDIAPAIPSQTDPYHDLRAILAASQPTAMMRVYATRTSKDEMFVTIDRGLVVQAAAPWIQSATQAALASALRPGLTASQLGVGWEQRTSNAGAFSVLDGQVDLFVATRDNLLFLATDESLLQRLLSPHLPAVQPSPGGVTYAAVFHHAARDQQAFRQIVDRLDTAGHASGGAAQSLDSDQGDGRSPAFFSGNLASLSRTFAHMTREAVQEKDQGAQVIQTVDFQWQRP